ncbi:MAG: MATE family efflux transporter [Clostridia bacterium]|nr:MATE family efflux transporter [Clostridia bacterium]
MKNSSFNMTTGNPLKNILIFAIPIMMSGLIQQGYNVADTYIAGRFISANALAAIGSVGPMSSLLMGFCMGVTGGFAIPIAQAFGAGDKKRTNHYAGNAIALTIIISLTIMSLSLFLVKPILTLLGTPDEIFKDARLYVSIIYAGAIFTTLYNVMASILRALGDSKAPLKFLTITAILNVFLNYFTIAVMGMGVEGAAISTVISQLVSCILCVIYIRGRREMLNITFEDMKIKKTTALLMLKMGVPMSLQFSITGIGSMVLQSTINTYGASVMAGFTIANKPELLANIPLSATGVACATFAGQNYGAGRMDRVRQGARSAILFAGSMSVVMSTILYFFGGRIAQIFVDGANAETINAAHTYLKVIAVFYFALAVLFVFRNTLQGIGKTYVSMLAGVSELIGRVVAALILSKLFGFFGVCLASPLAWMCADIPLLIIYYIKVIKKQDRR